MLMMFECPCVIFVGGVQSTRFLCTVPPDSMVFFAFIYRIHTHKRNQVKTSHSYALAWPSHGAAEALSGSGFDGLHLRLHVGELRRGRGVDPHRPRRLLPAAHSTCTLR
jgi:hypothetical protein